MPLKKQKRNKKSEKMSVQDSLQFKKVFKDGICKVTDDFYSKTICFDDVNYQLSDADDQQTIFEGFSSFLDYFDPNISFQFSFLNIATNEKHFKNQIIIAEQDDNYNDIRNEYSEFLQSQLKKGNNGLQKLKYLTFGINESTYNKAKNKLDKIELNIYNNFKKIGVKSYPLNGLEKLELMQKLLNMDEKRSLNSNGVMF